jgi:hypothetical protein
MPPKDPTIEEAKAFRKRARPVNRDASPPMTLGNMRENGVHSLFVYCPSYHHSVELNVDGMPGEVEVPSIGPRMVCSRSDARPDWSELSRSANREAGADEINKDSSGSR